MAKCEQTIDQQYQLFRLNAQAVPIVWRIFDVKLSRGAGILAPWPIVYGGHSSLRGWLFRHNSTNVEQLDTPSGYCFDRRGATSMSSYEAT
jgi:hypothetical protein